ncbi:Bacteroides conjugative transposon TraM protein [Mucilaginibacter pineti]|uniref:Bacteroides conjugative transposon TraM protein n=1 Tax=Mucilaginibacter pineti TaxID=1391627 RepID=A0A1G7L633_9SPHI|nr:conjugative transposon protein TraM [Mucilaginibacter pineti]SDF44826.1 Bacteroides conjugative transposon TraM protein [Mucilaginibacter pineti]
MEKKTLSSKMLRQRKVLLALPLLVLPFLTMFFWALGGGKVNPAEAKADTAKGLNMNLPDAVLKGGKDLNKLSYYDKAAADSVKLKEQMKSDPYYHHAADSAAGLQLSANAQPAWRNSAAIQPSKLTGGNTQGANEAQVYQKLAQLQTAINKPVQPVKTSTAASVNTNDAVSKSQQITQEKAEDPELKQMNGLLEKIMDIQHPDRVTEKTDPQAKELENKRFKAIPAVIDGKQKITQGTVVRLKLLDTVTINGQLIPKGQLIYGSGELYNQRLTMNIKIIRMGTMILPVDLTVFDMTDGLEGICVPEAVTGDAVKDGAAGGVQGMEFMSFDPSMSAQLAGAGVNAAKGLFTKKVKRIKAKLKDGHPLLLRDNKKLREVRL